jgi:hypothetical protein
VVLNLDMGIARRRRQAEVTPNEWERNEGQGLVDVGEKVWEVAEGGGRVGGSQRLNSHGYFKRRRENEA